MSIKKWFLRKMIYIDDLKIKKKFLYLFLLCVLLPLLVTDSFLISNLCIQELKESRHEIELMTDSIITSLQNEFESAFNFGINIYKNKYLNEALCKAYEEPLEYVDFFHKFKKETIFPTDLGNGYFTFTIYVDNPTVISGSYIQSLTTFRNTGSYKRFIKNQSQPLLYFDYEKTTTFTSNRKMILLRKLDYYGDNECERVLKIDLDYSSKQSNLFDVYYKYPLYICSNDIVLYSNIEANNSTTPFEAFTKQKDVIYRKDFMISNCSLCINVLKSPLMTISIIKRIIPVFFVLITFSILFPCLLLLVLSHSFTDRITKLAVIVNSSNGDELQKVSDFHGKDEIGVLMRNYNNMVEQIQTLIQTVYKNKIKAQEMIVARQNAELQALHGQINPHFLFNALESIRMHSVIKHEDETAKMVEQLAVMQRQYVDWGNDSIEIQKEMEFVEAYLELQKYRFGNRLSYKYDCPSECTKLYIPKLSIVTFVENACVHGIEQKSSPCWIFVKVNKKNNLLQIEIEDTGAGMSNEECSLLLHKMNNAKIEMFQKNGRVGIVNACLRLKIATENNVHFYISSEESMGTCVTIEMPVSYCSGGDVNA